MRLASIRPNEIALVKDDSLMLIGELLAAEGILPHGASIADLIANWERARLAVIAAEARATRVPLDPMQLRTPIPQPSKIWAAASNFQRGGTAIGAGAGRGEAATQPKEAILEMMFLKPPSALIGPEERVIIPRDVETLFPELELGVVIGKRAKDLSRDQALDAIFGYTIMLDMTARNEASVQRGLTGSRNVRKGYDTFAPTGPWIVTRDEVPDPQDLRLQLWVNGELRQSATTGAMLNGVVDLVTYLSRVSTLLPGDLISTGNPDSPGFQQSLEPGDVMRAEIERIGTMTLYVERAAP
jgi:2-keto-4-pentenoate hydratase/2-oxohepta-3-ene-1,7-dioic acid hydratase in catechol pathway